MRPKRSLLHSVTRLTIGGLFVALDEVNNRLFEWESKPEPTIAPESFEYIEIPPEDDKNALREGLVGLVFVIEDQIHDGFLHFDRITRWVGQQSGQAFSPILSSRLGAPFMRQFNQLAQRGQYEIDVWRERGKREERVSRKIVLSAIDQGIDQTVNLLADKPEIQELVQSQSASLAAEVIEEIRERTVSSDNYLESIARSMLRRPPRSELPEPGPEIREQVRPLKKFKGRVKE